MNGSSPLEPVASTSSSQLPAPPFAEMDPVTGAAATAAAAISTDAGVTLTTTAPGATVKFPPLTDKELLHASFGRVDSDATGLSASASSFASSQRPILVAHESDFTSATSASTSGRGGGSSGGTGLGTKLSWKRGVGKKAADTVERRRLAALGFEEELQRDFDFWASWGIGVCNIGFLPGTILGALSAMNMGGGSYAFAWPITGLFMCALAACLGEMASTWPVAGAMFTWTFRLCRSSRSLDGWARYASWIVGSFTLCYHIVIQIVLAYQLSHVLQGIIGMYNEVYITTFWKSMGFGWLVLILCGLVVSSRLSRSPMLWRLSGVMIVSSCIAINIILLVHAHPIRPASYVFMHYNNSTGFTNRAYVYLIGWALTCIATGLEACAHMAEDTKDPARTVPMAMFWSTATSYFLGWFTICVVLATVNTTNMGTRIQQPSGVLLNTLPRSWATLVVIMLTCTLVAQNVAQLLATSRFIWALARESALPFSAFFHRLSKSQGQPLPAIWATVVIAAFSLLLIGISTSIVGTILLEGAGWGAMAAYLIPVLLYLAVPRDTLAGDGRAQWTLRAFSKPVAWAGAAFGCMFLIVVCFPTGYPVNRLTLSYSSVIAVSILLLSTLSWIFYGNARYAGPIKTSTRWTLGAEVELPSSNSLKTSTVPPFAAAGATTSAAHGRSAHVFSSFPSASAGGQGESHSTSYYATDFTSGFTTGTGDYESEVDGDDHDAVEEPRASHDTREELKSDKPAGEYWDARGRWLSGSALEQGCDPLSGVRERLPGPPHGKTP